MRSAVLCLAVLALSEATHAQTPPRWDVREASVRFEIRNAGLPVRGTFAGLEADVRFDPHDIDRSAIVASIDASTIDTGIGIRDRHLRKRDYFDVGRHPRIRMESVAIEKGAGNAYNGTFLLDIKGIHRKVSIPFTFAMRDAAGTFAGSFTINRQDYRIGTSSLILSDDVTVHVTVVVSRVAP